MSNVEEEIDKLQDEIDRFLREEGAFGLEDDGDDEVAASSVPRARPGAITPLGVRVDRGAGLLGVNGTTATINEMDSVLSNIRAWKQKHERDMLELRKHHEAALGEAEPPAGRDAAAPIANGNHAAPSANAGVNGARSPGPTAAPTDPAEELQGILAYEDDEDLRELLRERQSRVSSASRWLEGQHGRHQDQRLEQRAEESGGRAANGGLAAGLGRSSAAGLSSKPWSTDGQALVESLAQGLPTALQTAAPTALRRPASAARKRAEAAANEAIQRGQQLLAELEAELRELEGPGGATAAAAGGASSGGVPHANRDGSEGVAAGPSGSSGAADGGSDGGEPLPLDPLLGWSVQLQSVLAKIDALQTGYQVKTAGPSSGHMAPGPRVLDRAACDVGRRPLSGTDAALLPPRPGSARLKLEPLPLLQERLAAIASGGEVVPAVGAAPVLGNGGSTAALEMSGGGGSGAAERGQRGSTMGSVGDGQGEVVPCAGHRMRQLKQLQRHGSGNGSGEDGSSDKER